MKNQFNIMKIKTATFFLSFIFLTSFSFAQTPDANGILYVKKGSIGNGSSWANPVGELADALKAAKGNTAIQQIWVAAGTYKPLYSPFDNNFGGDDGRNNSFLLVKNVKVYGGFAGTESGPAQRDFSNASNQSILSADINDDDTIIGTGETLSFSNNAENHYHTVMSFGDVGDAELNGFTVIGGNANREAYENRSINSISVLTHADFAGLYIANSSPTITLCTFSQNSAIDSGGGAGVVGSGKPTITHCKFLKNNASGAGGGLYLTSVLNISECLISENKALSGGGIFIDYSSPTLNSCTISNNYASSGGGLHNESSPTLVGCKFLNNKAESGGAVYIKVNFSNPKFLNCLIANNFATGNSGGALAFDDSSLNTHTLLLNCTLYGNTSNSGLNLRIPTGELIIQNCILWDNGLRSRYAYGKIRVTKSLVDGNITNLSWGDVSYTDLIPRDNVTTEMLFVDAANGNFKPKLGGPAIGSGDNSLYENGDGNANNNNLLTDKDLAGKSRLNLQNIDLGAYENTNTETLYVRQDATGDNSGNSWENALPQLADALLFAKNTNKAVPGFIKEIWVAKGTYKPMYSAEDTKFGTDQGRDNSFLLVVGIKVYGGFAGTETTLAQRDLSITANSTTLSGDFNNDDIITGKGQSLSITNNSENAYHVVISADNSTGAVLDGFTITGGNANTNATFTVSGQTVYRTAGGGLAVHGASPNLSNLKVYGNSANISGGGVYLYEASPALNQVYVGQNKGGGMGIAFGAPSLTKVVVEGNNALYGGGINVSSNASPILEDVSLLANYASGNGGGVQITGNATIVFNRVNFVQNETAGPGGAAYISYSSPKFVNVAFTGNSAQKGGALYAIGTLSAPQFTNCTFKANQAAGGQAIYIWETAAITLNNCIVWKDASFIGNNNLEENNSSFILKNTMLQYPGNGFNITLDMASTALLNKNPLFGNGTDNIADTNDDDLSLKPGSFAIGAGSNALYENADGNSANNNLSQDKDLAGNPRLIESNIDLGAFEAPAALPITLLSFQIKKDNNAAVLAWETASEKDNAGFEIFRAADNKSFVSLATLTGKGTTDVKNSYTWYDRKPLNGTNYYKLVQRDKDGKTEELGIRALNFTLNNEDILLYPNPVIEKANVLFTSGKYKNITLVDISGRILQQLQINPTETEKVIVMDSIPKGTYLLKLQGETQKTTVKIIKK